MSSDATSILIRVAIDRFSGQPGYLLAFWRALNGDRDAPGSLALSIAADQVDETMPIIPGIGGDYEYTARVATQVVEQWERNHAGEIDPDDVSEDGVRAALRFSGVSKYMTPERLEKLTQSILQTDSGAESSESTDTQQQASKANLSISSGQTKKSEPVPIWRLAEAKAPRGYIPILRDYLSGALLRGDPLPTAREVLEAWNEKPPHGITVQPGLRGFKYSVNGAKESEKDCSPGDLGRAISRHTEVIKGTEET